GRASIRRGGARPGDRGTRRRHGRRPRARPADGRRSPEAPRADSTAKTRSEGRMFAMARALLSLLLLAAAPQDALQLQEVSDAFGGRRTALTFNDRPAFVILPKGDAPAAPRGWVWYAPTFKNQYPNARHTFLIERALKAGMGVAGIDVGESYGSPEGTRLFEGFHDAVVAKFKLSPKAVLLPQSRGGLMLYNWATLHPDQV